MKSGDGYVSTAAASTHLRYLRVRQRRLRGSGRRSSTREKGAKAGDDGKRFPVISCGSEATCMGL